MWEGLEVVRVYTSELDARVDLARLEGAGIAASLATDNCGGMRPHLDLDRGVRLLVEAERLDEARELLRPACADDTTWTCSACGTAGEPGYDACWSCGHQRD